MKPSLKNRSQAKSSGLVPDYFADSVLSIDFVELHKQGIKYLVLDVDHTVTHYGGIEIDKRMREYLKQQRNVGLIKRVYLASNSLRDLSEVANTLDAQIVRATILIRKPRKKYFDELLGTIGSRPQEVVMVGDRLINDIWGGNRAGLTTILVTPIGKDFIISRLMLRRFWVRQYLKKQKEPE